MRMPQRGRRDADSPTQGADGDGGVPADPPEFAEVGEETNTAEGPANGGAAPHENGAAEDSSTAPADAAVADGRKTPKRTEEERVAAFSRLASQRASAAVDAIRLLGHLANPTHPWISEEKHL